MTLEDPYEGQKFSSFEDLKKYLEEYGKRNFVKFWIRSSHTISSMKTRSPKKINPELKYVCMKFACIFGGEKIRCRGSGIRKSTTYRNLGCPCMINAVVGEDGNHVKLDTVVLDHNHALCKSLYDSLKNSKNKIRALHNQVRMNKDFLLRQSAISKEVPKRTDNSDPLPPLPKPCDVSAQIETNNESVYETDQADIDNSVTDEPSYIQGFFKKVQEKYGNNIKILVVNNEDSASVKPVPETGMSSDVNDEEEDDISMKESYAEYQHLKVTAEKEICRLCLSTSNKVSPIFKPSLPLESTVLSFKIMSCASIEVSNNDDLPCNICSICEEILEIAYNFRMRCENSDSILRKVYASNRLIDISGNTKSNENDSSYSKKVKEVLSMDEPREQLTETAESADLTSSIKDGKEADFEYVKNQGNGTGNELYEKMEETCPVCGNLYGNYIDLVQHMKEHSDIENLILTCNFCGVIFITVKSLLDHMNEHLFDVQNDWTAKMFACTQCDLNFLTMEEAKTHEETHTPKDIESYTVEVQTEKTSTGNGYVCSVCGKILKSKDRFQSHRNTHEGLRPHVCLECGRGFADRKNMHQHYDIVHLRKAEHECPICHKKFYAPTKMKSHLTMHYGVKPFSCDVCGKSFRLRMNMVKHKKTHSNERPHKCDKCNAAFIDKNLLTRHSYVHGGVRPYACPFCGHRFTLRFNLKKHMASGKCNKKGKEKEMGAEYFEDWTAMTGAQSEVSDAEKKCVVNCEPNGESDFSGETEPIRMDILQEYEEKQ